MPDENPTTPFPPPPSASVVGYNAFHIGLRYLFRKKLTYLAVVGITLSVGTLIVVMSVFTGFQLKLTSVIRGYLSDLSIQPAAAGLHSHALRDWQLFREKALAQPHATGVAPFIQSVGLMRLPRTDYMSYVFFRGVDPALEPTVSDLRKYMIVGAVADLDKVYVMPDGSRLRACFVGKEFPGFSPESLRLGPGQLILVTATSSLERRLRKYAVNGMFETGNYEYDSQMVIMGLDPAMDLVDSGGGVTGLSVKLDDYQNAEPAREALQKALAWGTVLNTLGGGKAALERVGLSADGSCAVGLTAESGVLVWAATAQQPLLSLPSMQPRPTVAALDYDGKNVLVGCEDGSAAVRPVEGTGKGFRFPAGQDGTVTAAAFSPNGFIAALGFGDGAIVLLDAETGEAKARLTGHTGKVNALTFDNDSAKLLSISADGTGRVWDVSTEEAIATLSPGKSPPVPATAGTFSKDARLVITGDADGRATLYDAATGKPLLDWAGGEGPALAAAFGEEPPMVMTASPTGVTLWLYQYGGALSKAQPLTAWPSEGGRLKSAAFDAGGTRVLAAAADGRARLCYGGAGFRIMTWEEQRKTFVEAVGMERFMMALILSLILIVAEFFIFAIVTTMVNERRRDIGILKAVGFTRGQICLIFLLVGLAIGVAGAGLGVGAGLVFADHINAIRAFIRATIGFDPFPPDIYYFKDIPTHVSALSVALTAGGAVVCSLLFSIIPALRAARVDPVQTLHYE
jgi:ABC-type lipoprotein release transport system permease subunit